MLQTIKEKEHSILTAPFLFWWKRVCAWTLTAGFLVGTAVCAQVMLSGFIRAMGDKAEEKGAFKKAAARYELALKIDPQNWRACKGRAQIAQSERRYVLNIDEKFGLAEEERAWFERAMTHNSKDPEIVSKLGLVLIFLSKSHNQANRGVSGTKGAELREKGLELLRQACRYRKFNDYYWWILGVQLRKAGLYEEALETFRSMETIVRTASSKKNIQWLEKKIKVKKEGISEEEEVPKPLPEATNIRMKKKGMNLDALLDQMD